MEFELTLRLDDFITYDFNDGEYSFYDKADEPISVIGEITIDGNPIGKLMGYELYNDDDFRDICDEISGDCEIIASQVCNRSGSISKKYLTSDTSYEKIFILDHIQIDLEFRNKGIGSAIIKNLSKMLSYKFDCGSNIFLCAGDFESAKKYGFESQEYKNGCKRLVEFYKKCGFKLIAENVMFYNAPSEDE